MDQFPIKRVTFGGFDKQDVARYVEQMAHEKQQLQEENESLRSQLEAAKQEADTLLMQLQSVASHAQQLESRVSELETVQTEAEQLRGDVQTLQSEAASLRGDAETYRQAREHLGTLELEAQKRADKLENDTVIALQRVVDQFRAQYQTLMSTFDTTSSHVTAELRKMEVNLSQLPRAMDQSGANLNELAAMLEKRKKSE